jgi:hypothetical protein
VKSAAVLKRGLFQEYATLAGEQAGDEYQQTAADRVGAQKGREA